MSAASQTFQLIQEFPAATFAFSLLLCFLPFLEATCSLDFIVRVAQSGRFPDVPFPFGAGLLVPHCPQLFGHLDYSPVWVLTPELRAVVFHEEEESR